MKRSGDVIVINEFPVLAHARTLQRESIDMFVQHDIGAQAYYVTSANPDGIHATVITAHSCLPMPGSTMALKLNEAQRRRVAYQVALERLARSAAEDIYYEDTDGRVP